MSSGETAVWRGSDAPSRFLLCIHLVQAEHKPSEQFFVTTYRLRQPPLAAALSLDEDTFEDAELEAELQFEHERTADSGGFSDASSQTEQELSSPNRGVAATTGTAATHDFDEANDLFIQEHAEFDTLLRQAQATLHSSGERLLSQREHQDIVGTL